MFKKRSFILREDSSIHLNKKKRLMNMSLKILISLKIQLLGKCAIVNTIFQFESSTLCSFLIESCQIEYIILKFNVPSIGRGGPIS